MKIFQQRKFPDLQQYAVASSTYQVVLSSKYVVLILYEYQVLIISNCRTIVRQDNIIPFS